MENTIKVEKKEYEEIARYFIEKIFPLISMPGALSLGGSILLSNLGIAVTKKIKTYAITATGWLLINPDFFKENEERAKKIYEEHTISTITYKEVFAIINYFLVLHELAHIIYGHVNDIEMFSNPSVHEKKNIAADRWANKFAAEALLKSVFIIRTSKGSMKSTLREVVNLIQKETNGDWNAVVDFLLGKGYVTDNSITEILKKAGIMVPASFDDLTSNEIFELLVKAESIEASKRSGFSIDEDESGGAGLPEQYPIDILEDIEFDDDDYVARKPSKDFEKAKKDPKKLKDIWYRKLVEAASANNDTGIGTAAGMLKETIEITLRRPMINFNKIVISAIEREFGINEFETPDELDDLYEIMKESDNIIDSRTMMYGVKRKTPSAIIFSNDLSMSMNEKEIMNQLGSEMYHALVSKNVKGIIQVQWDTIIQDVSFTSRPTKTLEKHGLGGTDPVPFFQMIAGEKTERNAQFYDKFWRLFRLHKAAKFVVFVSDFGIFEEDLYESARYINNLEREGWKFIFINLSIKKAVAPQSNAAEAFLKIAGIKTH